MRHIVAIFAVLAASAFKSEAQSKAPWDYYRLVATVKGEDAFRPLAEGNCPYLPK